MHAFKNDTQVYYLARLIKLTDFESKINQKIDYLIKNCRHNKNPQKKSCMWEMKSRLLQVFCFMGTK